LLISSSYLRGLKGWDFRSRSRSDLMVKDESRTLSSQYFVTAQCSTSPFSVDEKGGSVVLVLSYLSNLTTSILFYTVK